MAAILGWAASPVQAPPPQELKTGKRNAEQPERKPPADSRFKAARDTVDAASLRKRGG
jgi:hypothetical protein